MTSDKCYCRYCLHMFINNVPYCEVYERVMSETAVKHQRKCKGFEFCEMDVFNPDYIYSPRPHRQHRQRTEPQGEQISLEVER